MMPSEPACNSKAIIRRETIAIPIPAATAFLIASGLAREPIRGGIMLTVAVIGLIANLASVFLLRGHHHGDLNMRSAFLHLLQDAVASALVVVAAIFSGWKYGPYLDPAVSILVLLLILRSGWGLLRDSVRILLEGTPSGLDLTALQRDIQEHFLVRDLHHVHVWEVNAGRRVLSAHVRLAEMPLAEAEALLKRIREHLAHAWAIEHATLEPEVNGCGSTDLIAARPSRQGIQSEPSKLGRVGEVERVD